MVSSPLFYLAWIVLALKRISLSVGVNHIQSLLVLVTIQLESFVELVSFALKINLLLFSFLDCVNGQVRLMGGTSDNEGTVEVCFDNVWGNIEETGWGDKDAQLVCNLLGGYLTDGKSI